MKTKIILHIVLAILVFMFGQTAFAAEPESTPAEPSKPLPGDAREIGHITKTTATVEAVNPETREITLKNADGDVRTFKVDESVKRLNEIKAGDKVKAEYYTSILSEIRPPTPAEKAKPLSVQEATAKSPAGSSPAGRVLRRIRAVVTVDKIDRDAGTVTITGPRGNTLTVYALDPARLDRVKVGDTVIVTYTEALAISVEKAE
jgi:Cu/Ag efflux protein CusF